MKSHPFNSYGSIRVTPFNNRDPNGQLPSSAANNNNNNNNNNRTVSWASARRQQERQALLQDDNIRPGLTAPPPSPSTTTTNHRNLPTSPSAVPTDAVLQLCLLDQQRRSRDVVRWLGLIILMFFAMAGVVFLRQEEENGFLSDNNDQKNGQTTGSFRYQDNQAAAAKLMRVDKVLDNESASSAADEICHNCRDPPHYFRQQKIDHLLSEENNSNTSTKSQQQPDSENEWTQRYYVQDKYFAGPGHPIFLVIGGEGETLGLLYPFVHEVLAQHFGAYVLQPELRFYGQSQPLRHYPQQKQDGSSPFAGLLTTEQAMLDALTLLQYVKDKLGCQPSKDDDTGSYCPVITVGGSYPGFISALMRMTYPRFIDISYASSAPLNLYAQRVRDPNGYFDYVTDTAELASMGCANAVRETLQEIYETILAVPTAKTDLGSNATNTTEGVALLLDEAKKMNICADQDRFPSYMLESNAIMAQEVTMVIGENFADFNMDFYPPSDPDTSMKRACDIFQNETLDAHQKMDQAFRLIDSSNGVERPTSHHLGRDKVTQEDCFDLSSQVPDGPNGRISGSDWTGLGAGSDARSWGFQCCSELIVQTGFSNQSMFIPRAWSLEWLTHHCQARYNVTPAPTYLSDKFHFVGEALSRTDRILFTNGLNDAWSQTSILQSPHKGIVVFNFPNGAHHSDLQHEAPSLENDTPDIWQGYLDIQEQLELWLLDIFARQERQD